MPNGIISLANQSYIHTTCGSNGSRQMGNAMRKILGVNKKKKFIYDGIPTISPESFSKGSAEGRLSFNSRRATVLNKLFMKYITDLMATGQYAPLILGHGIEINRVRITPDYKCLNVYWVARGSQDDKAIDDILHKNAGFLRHELSQLRVMGNVPIIQFVKDKQYAHMMALDHRLAIADYGEDHIPSDYTLKLKSELEIFAPLEEDIKKRISEMDEKNPTDDSEELPLPTMPQNVLGLDHAAIMNRVCLIRWAKKRRMITTEERRLGTRRKTHAIQEVIQEELVAACDRLMPRKAAGPDGIAVKTVKKRQ
ncbi:hypothetical protein JTB14_009784 [Gonioctena quinquepunctata]|nr:hypothetical protein JTB14_009784 [Gonioctena quinquepunctata]